MGFFRRIWAALNPAPPEPTHWISWYQEPREFRPVAYLAKSDYIPGFYYVTDIDKAHRFESKEQAELATPVYDGSSGISARAGVIGWSAP